MAKTPTKNEDDEPKKGKDEPAPASPAQEPYPTGKPYHEPTPGVPMNEAPKKEE